MGESPSARTDRELSALRATIDSDLRVLQDHLKEDLDVRRLARRNPIAVFGTLGSVLAVGTVGVLRSLAERSRRRNDTDVDALIARLGGRVDKLRGRARKRFRDQLRKEIGEVEQGPRAKQVIWEAAAGALTAGLTVVARRFAGRLVADEDLPMETSPRSNEPPARG